MKLKLFLLGTCLFLWIGLFLFRDSLIPRAAAQADWGAITIGRDANGPTVRMENSKIRVTWRYYTDEHGNGEHAIKEFLLKGYENQVDYFLDASADRGKMTQAEIVFDGPDRKTVRLKWLKKGMTSGVFATHDYTMYPDSMVIRIDYLTYGVNVVDLGRPGGATSATMSSYAIYGSDQWIRTIKESIYPGVYYDRTGDAHTDPANAGSLNYNGYFIIGEYNLSNQRGLARVFPVKDIDILKLWSYRGAIAYPYFGKLHQAYTSYLYGVTGGASEVLAVGMQLSDGSAAPTPTSISTSTFTPSPTLTWTPTFTPTPTIPSTSTFTPTPTFTISPTFTSTSTSTPTPTTTFTSTSTPTPTFTPSPTPAPSTTPQEPAFSQIVIDPGNTGRLVVGDVSGDRLNDIVATNAEALLVIYIAPHWTRAMVSDFGGFSDYKLIRSDDLELGDIDQDGDLDAVTRIGINDDVNGVVVWFENPLPSKPATSAWPRHDVGKNEYAKDIALDDIDRDGKLDIVTREHTRVQVWFQNNPTSWTKKEMTIHPREGMETGDLDQDGDIDIVLNGYWLETPVNPRTGTYVEHTIDSQWYSGQTQGFSWQRHNAKVALSDIDGDGVLDVLLAHSELPGYPVAWYSAANPQSGPWTRHVIADVCDYCHNLQVADFDKDGNMDVLAGGMPNSNQRGLQIYLGNGGGSWQVLSVQSLGSYSAELGDIHNDGDMDIVTVRNYDQPPIEIWENRIGATRMGQ